MKKNRVGREYLKRENDVKKTVIILFHYSLLVLHKLIN
jgi:hypothetical protein